MILGNKKFVIIISALLILLSLFLSYRQQQLKQNIASKDNSLVKLIPKVTPVLSNTVYTKKEVPKEVSLIFTGDVIPARMVNYTMTQKNDFYYPFASTSAFLRNADLTIINMEAPLIKRCPITQIGMVFCGDQRFVSGLHTAGVDVVALANNHILNYGKDGLDQTVKLLDENKITAVGINNIVYKDVRGTKVAFVNYNDILPRDKNISIVDEKIIKEQIIQAKQNADFVVALFHWGKEYSYAPISNAPVAISDPTKIAYLAIDNGADLVVGNHPHTVQGYEKYKNKYIFYALGNFIFDQMWSEQTKLGYVLKIKLHDSTLSSFDFYPIKIYDYAQPRFLEGKEKNIVLGQIKDLTKK